MSTAADALAAAGGTDDAAAAAAAAAGAAAAPAAAAAAPAAAAPAAWLAGLQDEGLRSNDTLSRYQSVDDLAKAHVETAAFARGRVPIPKDEAGFKELGEKLRPESADKYEIPVPDGDDGSLADQFKQFAFDTGLPPQWAKSVAEFSNRAQADAMSKMVAANQAEMKGLELNYGPAGYNARLDAVSNMFEKAGIEGFEAVSALEQSQGAGKAMEALFKLAESTGELGKVDTVGVELRMDSLTAAQATAEIDRMFNDKEIAKKLEDKTSPEYKRYEQLTLRQAKG